MPHCETQPLVPSAWNGEYDSTLMYVGSSTLDKTLGAFKVAIWKLHVPCICLYLACELPEWTNSHQHTLMDGWIDQSMDECRDGWWVDKKHFSIRFQFPSYPKWFPVSVFITYLQTTPTSPSVCNDYVPWVNPHPSWHHGKNPKIHLNYF